MELQLQKRATLKHSRQRAFFVPRPIMLGPQLKSAFNRLWIDFSSAGIQVFKLLRWCGGCEQTAKQETLTDRRGKQQLCKIHQLLSSLYFDQQTRNENNSYPSLHSLLVLQWLVWIGLRPIFIKFAETGRH
ncbi:hypothetical protein PPTG_01156 [Phytophthora nicotianae INRA-310]|uniref:Uncharacterized protein n=1 Tax=Phytophthora nicotianae (strain INRA-310) TaxID=761204 RepID=W2RK62_PHYN3|nr:hypothetical protein PPTG_01156 [Phytophthora nicotianae INRA-310]ETN25015.1 hypothetical protein PPTG_01156 [Phytophthora nicotianae INRA-310]